jgi:hypothetical protein
VAVAYHAVDQPEDAVHVRIVQLALGTGVAGKHSADQFTVVHRLRRVRVPGQPAV